MTTSQPQTSTAVAAGTGDLATQLARTALRVALGVVMFAHGWQKVSEGGLGAAGEAFAGMGIPAAAVAGPAVALLELVGGVALVLGVATPLIAGLNALAMLGALFLVHLEAGFYASDGGIELVLVLAVASLYVAVAGAGRFSLDAVIARASSRWGRLLRVG